MWVKITSKRLFLLVLFFVAFGILYLWISTYSLNSPKTGPWLTSEKNPDPDRDNGFRLIDKDTGANVESGDGLKFYYSWPHQKWLSFSMEPGKHPILAVLDSDPSGKTANLQIYYIRRELYRRFLDEFDNNSSGYRIMSSGWDGEGFCYERWNRGIATSYYGNATFSYKDKRLYKTVGEMVAKIKATSPPVL